MCYVVLIRIQKSLIPVVIFSLLIIQAREAMAALSTQILQYTKKNNIIPEKPKLLRKDMFAMADPIEEYGDRDKGQTRLTKNASRTSVISVKSTGGKR